MESDGFYIGTAAQCDEYNATVCEGENYGTDTTTWAAKVEHPTNGTFAIPKHIDYTHNLMTWTLNLDSSWDSLSE